MFRATVWSLVPVGIWYLIRSIVIIGLSFGADFPANPEGVMAQEEINSVMNLVLGNPIFVVTQLLGVVFAIWSWYLLSVGIAEAREVSMDDAKRIAVIPAGTVALYSAWLALTWQGIL